MLPLRLLRSIWYSGSLFGSEEGTSTYGEYRLPDGATFRVSIDENDLLRIQTTDKNTYRLLLADGTEKEEETQLVAKRTLTLIDNNRKGRYEFFANAGGFSPEEAENQAKEFWTTQEANYGAFQSAEEFCTVAREKRGLMLAFIKLNFARQSSYQMYVWEGEALVDIQIMETPEKVFDHLEGLTFHAPNNERTVILQDKRKPGIMLHWPGGEIQALRIKP